MNKLSVIPSVKGHSDKEVADRLAHLHEAGVNATKLIFDAGLYCFWIKENLPSGQFGKWLQANRPELAVMDAKTGNPKACPTLSWQMGMTKKLIESCKTTVERVIGQIPKSWEFGESGKFLTFKKQIPQPLLALHQDCSKRCEGRTAYQLFLELKQAEEDETGEVKTKRGRLKGQGGASKEQRLAAKAREEQEKLLERELELKELGTLADQCADNLSGDPRIAKQFGATLMKLDHCHLFLKRINDSRK